MTAGMRWIAPSGAHEVFQGHGPAELAPYLTGGKEFGNCHVLATTGYKFPAGPGSDNTKVFYANVHLDRRTFGWLYPLVEFNTVYHTTSVSFGLPTARGLFDFDNFEATGNIVTMAAGANAVLIRERLEVAQAETSEARAAAQEAHQPAAALRRAGRPRRSGRGRLRRAWDGWRGRGREGLH